MGFSDALGGLFGAVGGLIGSEDGDSRDEKSKIEWNLQNQAHQNGLFDRYARDEMGKSAFEGISTDPRTRAAQMEALASFQGLANQQGLDPQSRAMQAEANHEAAGFEQQQRQAMQQNMAARGMGGSGAEVAGLAAAEQGGANRSSAAANSAAADARNRAMLATQQQGQLSGAIRGQDWGEAAQAATAKDAQNRALFQGRVAAQGMADGSVDKLNNYYGADRAERIGNYAAMGKGVGATAGSVFDLYGGGGMGGGGAGGGGGGNAFAAQGGQSFHTDASSNSRNPYGSWGGY